MKIETDADPSALENPQGRVAFNSTVSLSHPQIQPIENSIFNWWLGIQSAVGNPICGWESAMGNAKILLLEVQLGRAGQIYGDRWSLDFVVNTQCDIHMMRYRTVHLRLI